MNPIKGPVTMVYRRLRLLLLAPTLVLTACTSPLESLLDDVNGGISRIVMNPDATCEQMARAFGVEFLPLVDDPGGAGLAFEEHWIITERNQLVHLWYLPSQLDRGTVVVSIGAVGPMQCYLFTARLLVQNGWSVLIYEYEGFGRSTGRATLESMIPDLNAVVDFAQGRSRRPQVTLFGISLGSIPSIAVAIERPEDINALVLDSPVALGEEMLRFQFLVGGQLDRVVEGVDGRLVSDWLVGDLHQPALFYLHELDNVTPPQTIERLYEATASDEKRLVRIPRIGHARGIFFDTDLYTKALEEFLWDIWKDVPRPAPDNAAPDAETDPGLEPVPGNDGAPEPDSSSDADTNTPDTNPTQPGVVTG